MVNFNSLLVDTLEAEDNKYEKTALTQLIVWTNKSKHYSKLLF